MAKRGAPTGNTNRQTHGLVAIQRDVARRARRGRDRIDKRTNEGKEAIKFRGGYIDDLGGLDNVSTGEFMSVVALSEAWWLRAMSYGAISKYLRKNPHLAENPRAIAKLLGYVKPIDQTVIDYLKLLGLKKRLPPQKTLEEILNEESEERE
jgi:hypothetical protein